VASPLPFRLGETIGVSASVGVHPLTLPSGPAPLTVTNELP